MRSYPEPGMSDIFRALRVCAYNTLGLKGARTFRVIVPGVTRTLSKTRDNMEAYILVPVGS